jgi:hypothetical protein
MGECPRAYYVLLGLQTIGSKTDAIPPSFQDGENVRHSAQFARMNIARTSETAGLPQFGRIA